MLDLIYYIAVVSAIPAVIISIYAFKRFRLPDIKILALFMLFSGLSELISAIMYYANINMSIFSGVHSTLEFLFIALYFSAQAKHRVLRKYYISAVIISACFMAIALVKQPLEFPGKVRAIQSILIVFMCLYHSYKWLVFEGSKFYELSVIGAFMIYFVLSFTSFYYVASMPKNWIALFFTINNLCNITANFLLFFALLNYLKKYGNNH